MGLADRADGAHAVPARRYSWAPFAPGNTVALKHGADSPRVVDPLVAELVAGLLVDRPDLERYPEAVMAWGRAEARCLLVAEYQVTHGLLDENGDVRSGKYTAQFEAQAERARARLGLDPRSEAELLRDQADAQRSVVDLDGIRERGRAALRARGGAA